MSNFKITPAKFAETFINLDSSRNFSFKGREYFIPIYNSNASTELFKTGRQCAKSTFLGNRIITRASVYPNLQVLYVAPKSDQSKTFSRQKLTPIVTQSPRLKPFLKLSSTGTVEDKNVFNFYCFKTEAYVKLSTTYNGVDRDRGISINDLYIDEVQDQLKEDIDILAEGLSASATDKYMAYAGTPKSFGNFIEKLWKESKQIVWLMKCEGCNDWQFPSVEKNIKQEGLVCRKCGKRLNVLNGEWVSLNRKGRFNGWHISQLMRLVKGMPGSLGWETEEGLHGIWDKFKRFTPEKFHNEVMGLSYDSATIPLTYENLRKCSFSSLKKQDKFDSTFFTRPIVMGIDWGQNTNNHTVISVSILYQDRPTIIYMRRLEGGEADPFITASIIKDIWLKFECTEMFADNGLFWPFEKAMRDVFGNAIINEKLNLIYYYQNDEKLIVKSKITKKRLFKVSRNDAMNLYVNSIKQKKVGIYNFDEFIAENFHDDFLAVGYETRHSKDRGERLFFLSSRDSASATDAFHSGLYSWLGVMMLAKKIKWYYHDEKKADVSY